MKTVYLSLIHISILLPVFPVDRAYWQVCPSKTGLWRNRRILQTSLRPSLYTVLYEIAGACCCARFKLIFSAASNSLEDSADTGCMNSGSFGRRPALSPITSCFTRHGEWPVSYTHLDVYKRQGFTGKAHLYVKILYKIRIDENKYKI